MVLPQKGITALNASAPCAVLARVHAFALVLSLRATLAAGVAPSPGFSGGVIARSGEHCHV
jgi:hypothetical protein